jgi:branched-chain amino acid transport system ATP-binding protein
MSGSSAASGIILRTEGVGKKFGGFTALKNITAEFQRGAVTAIIGPNGAGKSTYFNLISGAFRPSSGRILFEGRDIVGLPQHRFARLGISKSFQITSVFPLLTTRENVRVALQAMVSRFDFWRPRRALGELYDRAENILETVGIADRAGRPAGAMAHGEQRAL